MTKRIIIIIISVTKGFSIIKLISKVKNPMLINHRKSKSPPIAINDEKFSLNVIFSSTYPR